MDLTFRMLQHTSSEVTVKQFEGRGSMKWNGLQWGCPEAVILLIMNLRFLSIVDKGANYHA